MESNLMPFAFPFLDFFFLFIMRLLFLGTRSFLQRKLWKEQNL